MSEINCTDSNGKPMGIEDFFMLFQKEVPEPPKRCDDTREGENHLQYYDSGPFGSRAKECMDIINDVFDVLKEKIDHPIVSVGSGNGVIEGILKPDTLTKHFSASIRTHSHSEIILHEIPASLS